MQSSKKFQMLVATIIGNILVMVIYHFFPTFNADVVQWVIGGISSAGIGGVLGQSFADGLSRGLTSSNAKTIVAGQLQSEALKNSSPPAPPVG